MSDVNHKVDVGLHGWGCPPSGTAGHCTKVYCSREGFLYFNFTFCCCVVRACIPEVCAALSTSSVCGIVSTVSFFSFLVFFCSVLYRMRCCV